MIVLKIIQRLFGRSPAPDVSTKKVEPLQPSPANALSSEEVQDVLRRYGVADLLTPQDDPVFWATVLQHFWPANELVVDAAQPIPPNFFFGIKEPSAETNIWSHTPRTKLVHLTSSADGQLRQQDSETEDGQNHPCYSIDVSRPSVGGKSGWFENRRQFGPTHGRGKSGACRYSPPGIWSTPVETVRSIS